MKVQVKNVRIFFVDYAPNSGFGIMANDRDGREYVLLDSDGGHRVMSYVCADKVVGKIKAAGHVVSVEHWDVRAPYGTQAWLIDGMEQRQIEDERFGYY
jgi:hypothetical protein